MSLLRKTDLHGPPKGPTRERGRPARILGSSARGSGFLASYHKTRAGSRVYSREFHELISEEKIFPDSEDAVGAYSWAAQDKICRAANGSIRVAKYQPWDEETPVQQIDFLSLSTPRNEPCMSTNRDQTGLCPLSG